MLCGWEWTGDGGMSYASCVDVGDVCALYTWGVWVGCMLWTVYVGVEGMHWIEWQVH